jgi:hypothetical protein
MSLDLSGAEKKAREYIDAQVSSGGMPCAIVRAKIKEEVDGWYFPYQSEEFLTTGDFNKSLVGNWPIFVSRDGRYVGPRRPGMPFATPKT